MNTSTPSSGRARFSYKIHWHIFFNHFPISLFLTSAAFMVAHLFTMTNCFEMASFITLVAATAILIPTTLTGWFTWKRRYQGILSKTFVYKTRIAYAMIAVSIILVLIRGFFAESVHTFWHWVFGAGFVLLFLGAMAEGYFGERLNHR